MRWPFDVPESLDYGKICETPAHLVEALRRHSIDDMVLFFKWASQDHTWITSEGEETLRLLMEHFNQQYMAQQLLLALVRIVSATVHDHFQFLKNAIPEDITLILDDNSISMSSLLLGVESNEFALMITRARNQILRLEGMNQEFFLLAKEFCLTGEIVNLWRKEPREIVELIRFAEHWHMHALSNFASDVLKRYIHKENILSYFLMAEEQHLNSLSIICCKKLKTLDSGVAMDLNSLGELDVELYYFTDFSRVILNQLANKITSLHCHVPASDDIQLIDFFHHLDALKRFDLSATNSIHQQLPMHFPSVRVLNLSQTGWLIDDLFLMILKSTPGLFELDISGSPELTFRSIGAIGLLLNLKKLTLNFFKQLNDESIDLLGASSSRVVNLSLEGCDQMSDVGLGSLARQCKQLRILNISGCDQVSDLGLIDFAGTATYIEKLELRAIKGLTAEAMKQVALICDSLLEIDLRGCNIEQKELENINKKNPRLQFLF